MSDRAAVAEELDDAGASGDERWAISLISAGHYLSHFYGLALPPLFAPPGAGSSPSAPQGAGSEIRAPQGAGCEIGAPKGAGWEEHHKEPVGSWHTTQREKF